MGQVLEKHGPMFRKTRRPPLRPGQPWNVPNRSRHSAARPQQIGQIQGLAAPMPAAVHRAITAFGLGPGKLGCRTFEAGHSRWLIWPRSWPRDSPASSFCSGAMPVARRDGHGGAPGSGGPKGPRNGNYKHGRYTAEAIASRGWLRQLTRDVRALTNRLRQP